MVNPPYTKKPCKKYNLNGLPENNCYIVVNTAQGLPALYCGTGSNANYVRGNQFTNAYDYYGLHKGAQYQVEQPKVVQNQIKIQATDHYYPYPHWNYTTDPKYYILIQKMIIFYKMVIQFIIGQNLLFLLKLLLI